MVIYRETYSELLKAVTIVSFESESSIAGTSYDRVGGDLFEKGWALNKLSILTLFTGALLTASTRNNSERELFIAGWKSLSIFVLAELERDPFALHIEQVE